MSEQYYQIFFRRFLIALQFLTRLPVLIRQKATEKDIGCSASYYPLIGLVIGLMLFIAISILQLLPITISPSILAALLLVLWVIITGGDHLDGLAAIINRPSNDDNSTEKSGNYNAMAVSGIVLVLLLKWITLESLISIQEHWVIIFIPALARAYILLFIYSTDYSSDNEFDSALINNFPAQKHIYTILFICSAVIFLSLGIWLFLLSILVFIPLWYFFYTTIKKTNSDSVGAVIEVMEISSLLFMIYLA